MASNERQFKAEIVQRAREQGGHVVVVSGSYLAGIPDLYVKMPDLPGVWLELKFSVYHSGGRYRNALTPLQRLFIRNHQHANGEAAWVLCVKQDRIWSLYGGQDPDVDRVDEQHHLSVRQYGQKWDVEKLLLMLGISPEA
jgi:hypothetical protein